MCIVRSNEKVLQFLAGSSKIIYYNNWKNYHVIYIKCFVDPVSTYFYYLWHIKIIYIYNHNITYRIIYYCIYMLYHRQLYFALTLWFFSCQIFFLLTLVRDAITSYLPPRPLSSTQLFVLVFARHSGSRIAMFSPFFTSPHDKYKAALLSHNPSATVLRLLCNSCKKRIWIYRKILPAVSGNCGVRRVWECERLVVDSLSWIYRNSFQLETPSRV